MSAFSIYQKPCPACGASVSTGTSRCDCGHLFESAGANALLPEEQALRDEELFEAYLAARIDQTVAAVESVRAELAADPRSPRKAARLVQAVQEALTLRDQRDAQAARIEQIRKAAQEARTKLSPSETKAGENIPAPPEVPAQSVEPTKTFHTRQAAKLMEAFANTRTKECPHCQTVLPVTSALCLCGYIFARNEFLQPQATGTSAKEDTLRTE